MRSILLLITALLLCCSGASAGGSGKYGGEDLSVGVGGRALGLGGAYSALAGDVTAGYWNPAGLTQLGYPQLALMHEQRFGGLVNFDFGAFALPLGATSTLGLSVIRFGVDDIHNTTNAWVDANHDGIVQSGEIDESKITSYNAAQWAFYLSYAGTASPAIAYGANLKILRRTLATTAATGIGFDLAVRYRATDALTLGANLQDVTTTLVAWNDGTNEFITPTLKLGSAYRFSLLGGDLSPAFDVDLRFENRRTASNAHLGAVSFDFHEGLEYAYQRTAAIRVGYSELATVTVGAGLHISKLDIDYAYAPRNADKAVDDTHRISLIFTFEAPQFARSAE